MSGDARIKALLPKLLPHLVPLSTQGNPQCEAHLQELQRIVFGDGSQALKASDLDLLSDHITFPFEVYFEKPWMSDNYTVKALDFVAKFYKTVPLNSSRFLLTTVDRLMRFCVGDQKKQISEDMKIAVCRCLTALFSAATNENLLEVYTNYEENKYRMSQVVLEALAWLTDGKDIRMVSEACLDLLESLCPDPVINAENPASMSHGLLSGFCIVFHQMLPGIATKVMKLLKDGTVKIRLKCQLLRVWTTYVSTIMGDRVLAPLEEIQLDLQGRPTALDERLKFSPEEKWINLAKDQICNQGLILAGLSASLIMDNVGVMDGALNNLRRQLLDSIVILSRRCWLVLNGMLAVHLDVFSHLSVFDGEGTSQIATDAHGAMNKLLGRLSPEARGTIASRAQETAFELASDLQKLSSESSLGSIMGRLQAAITLIGGLEDSSVFFLSETYLQRVVNALLKISSLENDPALAGGYGFRTDRDYNLANVLFQVTHNNIRCQKTFRHLTSPELVRRKASLLQSITRCSSSLAVINLLLDVLTSAPKGSDGEKMYMWKKEACLLLGEIIDGKHENFGITGERDEDAVSLLRRVLDVILEVITRISAPHDTIENALVSLATQPKLNGKEKEFEIWGLPTLCVDVIGKIALESYRLSWTDFKLLYLPTCLSSCLFSTDLSSQHQTDVLISSLQNMSKGCEFSGIPELLTSHLDLLSHDLVLGLRRVSRNPNELKGGGVRTLLRVLLRSAAEKRKLEGSSFDAETDLGLSDVMDSLLTQLDLSWLGPDPEATTELLDVVLIFVQALDDQGAVQEPSGDTEDAKCNVGSVTQLLLDLQAADKALEMEDDEFEACPPEGFHQNQEKMNCEEDTDRDDQEDDDASDEDKDKIVTPRVRRLREALDHTRHFVSMSKQPRWQIAAMDIVARCAAQLQMDRVELLPLLHQCWQPLKLLFDYSNLFILEKAFGVVLVFARCAGDFVASRTIKDVLPPMLNSARKLQSVLAQTERRHTLAYRQSVHLLDQVVQALSELPVLLDLDEPEVDRILEELIAYEQFVRQRKGLVVSDKGYTSVSDMFVPKRALDADSLALKTRQPVS